MVCGSKKIHFIVVLPLALSCNLGSNFRVVKISGSLTSSFGSRLCKKGQLSDGGFTRSTPFSSRRAVDRGAHPHV